MDKVEIDNALAEIARLLSHTTHPRVVSILKSGIQNLQAEKDGTAPPAPSAPAPAQSSAPAAKPVATPTAAKPAAASAAAKPKAAPAATKSAAAPAAAKPPAPASKAVVPVAVEYTSLTAFSWDQTDEQVKIYLELLGVSKDLVEVDFTDKSVDVKVHGLSGKNYRFRAQGLFKDINPDTSSFMIPKSQKRIVVKLQKSSATKYDEKKWADLKAKDSALSNPGAPATKADDPSAGIMELMKNMYNDGDDDMKRTIAKAWTESRDGKTPDMPTPEMPDFGDMGGMGGMPDMPDMPDMSKLMKGMGGMGGL